MPHELIVNDDFGELMRVSYSNGRSTFSPTADVKMKCGTNEKGQYEVKLRRDDGDRGVIVEQENIILQVK